MITRILTRPGRPELVCDLVEGGGNCGPGVIFLGGFRSDRTGVKATHLAQFCRVRGMAYVRFDYSGHGESGGAFVDQTLDMWRDDVLAVFDRMTAGPQIVVGSSMGGWLGLLLAMARTDRVRAFVGIAAAPDFTRTMIDDKLDDAGRAQYDRDGYVDIPNAYSDEPYRVTRALIESGNRLCLLDRVHMLEIPMSLLQGGCDSAVDPAMPHRIRTAFPRAAVTIRMIDEGDHSLSRPQDLALLEETIISVCT